VSANRPESQSVMWIFVYEEEGGDQTTSIDGLIPEGTQVTLMNRNSKGKYTSLTARVAEDGIVR
ncbi:hypothetical protein SK128_004304, partial [Halocaridina rubra]